MYKKRGILNVAFGDINLEEIKIFKEKMIKDLGMNPLFPLWGKNTLELVEQFFATGHKALVTSVYGEKLGYNYLACEFNEEFIKRLPPGVDPAGENGEFHTFVTFGPTFKMRVAFSKSIAVEEGPYFVSLIKEP
jgi:diphthamide synthase (EF-2-diphthine--ammonia ligase)